MINSTLFAIALLLLLFGLISKRIQGTILTAPILFTLFGLAAHRYVSIDNELTKVILELTLVMILFTDGHCINIGKLKKHHNLALRLLIIGMPLSILLGTIFAINLFSYLDPWGAAILATVVAPTDAALGEAAYNNPKIPKTLRQNLTVESGLNDGLVVPVIIFLLACDSLFSGAQHFGYWIFFIVQHLGLGLVVGVVVGILSHRAIVFSSERKWMSETFHQMSGVAIALLAYALSITCGGNGLIAAFVAGLSIDPCATIGKFADRQCHLLSLISFMIFGAVILLPAIAIATWHTYLFAILALTVVRFSATFIATIGLQMSLGERIFTAWMGPQGIASLLFAILVLDKVDVDAREPIFQITCITVALSIFVHGLTSTRGILC